MSKFILRCEQDGKYDTNKISNTYFGTKKTNSLFELVAKFYRSNDVFKKCSKLDLYKKDG